MEITLNNEHLKEIDGFIKKTPFEFAYPLFQYLTGIIQEQTNKSAKVVDIPKKESFATKAAKNGD